VTDHLIRLYPADWRARYGDELIALLAERPPTVRDRIDIVRGAVDARVNPQLGGDLEPMPISHRVPGLLALVAGLAWSLAYLSALISSPDAWGQSAWSWSFPLALLLGAVALPSEYLAVRSTWVLSWVLATIGLVPLSIALIGSPALVVVVSLGTGLLSLAARRAGYAAPGVAVAVAAGVGVPLVAGVLGSVSVVGSYTVPFLLAVTMPYGLTWMALGMLMIVRGAPTLLPPRNADVEVAA